MDVDNEDEQVTMQRERLALLRKGASPVESPQSKAAASPIPDAKSDKKRSASAGASAASAKKAKAGQQKDGQDLDDVKMELCLKPVLGLCQALLGGRIQKQVRGRC